MKSTVMLLFFLLVYGSVVLSSTTRSTCEHGKTLVNGMCLDIGSKPSITVQHSMFKDYLEGDLVLQQKMQITVLFDGIPFAKVPLEIKATSDVHAVVTDANAFSHRTILPKLFSEKGLVAVTNIFGRITLSFPVNEEKIFEIPRIYVKVPFSNDEEYIESSPSVLLSDQMLGITAEDLKQQRNGVSLFENIKEMSDELLEQAAKRIQGIGNLLQNERQRAVPKKVIRASRKYLQNQEVIFDYEFEKIEPVKRLLKRDSVEYKNSTSIMTTIMNFGSTLLKEIKQILSSIGSTISKILHFFASIFHIDDVIATSKFLSGHFKKTINYIQQVITKSTGANKTFYDSISNEIKSFQSHDEKQHVQKIAQWTSMGTDKLYGAPSNYTVKNHQLVDIRTSSVLDLSSFSLQNNNTKGFESIANASIAFVNNFAAFAKQNGIDMKLQQQFDTAQGTSISQLVLVISNFIDHLLEPVLLRLLQLNLDIVYTFTRLFADLFEFPIFAPSLRQYSEDPATETWSLLSLACLMSSIPTSLSYRLINGESLLSTHEAALILQADTPLEYADKWKEGIAANQTGIRNFSKYKIRNLLTYAIGGMFTMSNLCAMTLGTITLFAYVPFKIMSVLSLFPWNFASTVEILDFSDSRLITWNVLWSEITLNIAAKSFPVAHDLMAILSLYTSTFPLLGSMLISLSKNLSNKLISAKQKVDFVAKFTAILMGKLSDFIRFSKWYYPALKLPVFMDSLPMASFAIHQLRLNYDMAFGTYFS